MDVNTSYIEGLASDDSQSLLDVVVNCPVIFQSQQMGDPDLTRDDKRRIAENMLANKPVNFLTKFGKFLESHHLNEILTRHHDSHEVKYYVESLKRSLCAGSKNRVKKNRRYEAMKRMEANGSYFSDAEMEKREPLFYYQMVGQYLNDHEKEAKLKDVHKNDIPSFSTFLLYKLEKEELFELMVKQKNDENEYRVIDNSDDNVKKYGLSPKGDAKVTKPNRKWGADWEDEENKCCTKKFKGEEGQDHKLEPGEKTLLYEEFKSTMQNKFLTGQDEDFNYSDIDSNSEYDCLELRSQDEEEKYFDQEPSNDGYTCTDTGIEDY